MSLQVQCLVDVDDGHATVFLQTLSDTMIALKRSLLVLWAGGEDDDMVALFPRFLIIVEKKMMKKKKRQLRSYQNLRTTTVPCACKVRSTHHGGLCRPISKETATARFGPVPIRGSPAVSSIQPKPRPLRLAGLLLSGLAAAKQSGAKPCTFVTSISVTGAPPAWSEHVHQASVFIRRACSSGSRSFVSEHRRNGKM